MLVVPFIGFKLIGIRSKQQEQLHIQYLLYLEVLLLLTGYLMKLDGMLLPLMELIALVVHIKQLTLPQQW